LLKLRHVVWHANSRKQGCNGLPTSKNVVAHEHTTTIISDSTTCLDLYVNFEMKLTIGSSALMSILSTMGAFGEGFTPFFPLGLRQLRPLGENQALVVEHISRGGADSSEIQPVYAAKTVSGFDKYKKIHAASIADPANTGATWPSRNYNGWLPLTTAKCSRVI
jgi:hypothetical protein